MALELYSHPLASFCWKVLIALYDTDTPFEPLLVDLSNSTAAENFKRVWPIAKFPVLRDTARNQLVPESTIIIEYLAQHFPAARDLIPQDPDAALETRLRDRFFDLYVSEPMQKIVLDKLRPPGANDPHGVTQAKNSLEVAYDMLERDMIGRTWATGDHFDMADCSAAPALYYANRVAPIGQRPNVRAYLERLQQRPSFARVLREAEPYFALFPG
ncbi:MAG TPA: glutathione S-transferase family protein [Polyangiaceae bacterium]|nr:glutathione S-transferase family protein [Polyangiaceae bacterium]